MSAENTPPKQRGIPFEPGKSGNPAGRPKGSRNKLGEAFVTALYADFEKHGEKVIEAVRTDKPDAYLKVVASILPKELNVRVSDLDDLSDAELDKRIRAIAGALELGITARPDPTAGGKAATAPAKPPKPVSAIH